MQKVGVETDRNWSIFFATTGLVTGLGVAAVWLFGGQEVIGGDLTLGTLLAFYSYMWLLYGPLQWFGQVNSWMTRAFAGAERIFEVIDTPTEAYEDPDAVPMPDMQGRVTFRKATFGYDKSKPVLREIELDVAPGEMIGLVGKSGVGKTTTVNLIARFYDVDHGGIEIDGVDLRKIRLEDLRRQIGLVLQEPFLFSGTIAENIGYGRPGASFEEIVEAAKAANAHAFIVAKPDGYDTQVGERGARLSGGERQRVSLARAILHNPRILILDEATSSVDVQTEKQIQEAIARLVQKRTTFAIAHRLSTLRNADRLVVLDAGRVVEVGTHQELLERQGHFYNLVQLQQQVSQIIEVKE
jgi:ATP-binding cassette subfamily B protein